MYEHVKLTPIEKKILECVVKGMTNQEIAASLNMSVKTVANYMSGLLDKLQCRNRTSLAVLYMANAAEIKTYNQKKVYIPYCKAKHWYKMEVEYSNPVFCKVNEGRHYHVFKKAYQCNGCFLYGFEHSSHFLCLAAGSACS
jgi:DNA-binding CsgD family transcriptional regulator